jgi:hypothetical protein
MAALVGDFCDEIARAGWAWGDRDCLLWLGTWAERNTGIDGGAPWRGRYKTALGCVRTLKRSGGMLACIERGAALAGMVETAKPEVGAVGLVEVVTPNRVEAVGAIFTGRRWAVLTAGGVLSVTATPVRAWNLP